MMIPTEATLPNWAASLIIDFPSDNIPTLVDEESWKLWGNTLVQENSFASNNAPGTNGYRDWRVWATDVYSVMSNF